MTDEELNETAKMMEWMMTDWVWAVPADGDWCAKAASAIRQLMDELKQARIAGAWLYGLELEKPADYAEQKPLAMHACRLVFRHPQELS
jgi:hypothetical protein